jgi:hypothetical protein
MKQKLWCCYNTESDTYYLPSLSYRKSDSQDVLRGNWKWEKLRETGWECIKVEVEIKPINEVK